jgi:tetratricopeptide (TPR) repeat protein
MARKAQVLASCLAIGLAVVLAYHGGIATPFHFDDFPGIVENPSIRDVSALGRVFSPPCHFGTTVNGRPLLNLTLAVNYAAAGTDPRGYHVVNIAIHVLAAFTLLGIIRRALLGCGAPHALAAGAAVALIWALHPLQTESVTYVIQRAESLAALFTLLTLYTFMRANGSGARVGWLATSVASCALGAFTKETAVVAPLLVLLYDAAFVAGGFIPALRQRPAYYGALFASWLILGALVASGGNRGGTAGFGVGVTAYTYALTQSHAVVRYLLLAVWPAAQVFDYGVSVAQGVTEVAPYLGVLCALLGAAIWGGRRHRLVALTAAVFFLALAPSSSVVPITTQTVAEHRMYLPLAAIVALAVVPLVVRWGPKAWLAVGPLAVGLGVLTIQRNQVYASELSLWRDTVAKVPDNFRAQNNLGKSLLEAGDTPAAMQALHTALRLKPEYPETHNNLGFALAQSGHWADAVAQYEEALRLRPATARAHDNLGNALVQLNRLAGARAHFEEALRLRPDFADAEWGLGNALAQGGQYAESIVHYDQALRLDPRFAAAHYSLGMAYAETGREDAALAEYREALRLKPAFPEAHNNLGNLFLRRGDGAGAVAEYRAALAAKPDFAEARVNLANALLEAGDPTTAISEYETVLRVAPDDVDARFGLGNALAQTNQIAGATAAFRAVVARAPNHVGGHVNLGNALLVSGHLAEAVGEYETAARLRPDDADVRTLLERARRLEGSP